MPSVRPILFPAKKVPTATARFFFSYVSRITRAPDGIMGASPTPTKARKNASGANALVTPHKTVANDHVPTPSGYDKRGRTQSVNGPARISDSVNDQLKTENSTPSSAG